jgi:hydrogenase-4 membrane subunit HyfE
MTAEGALLVLVLSLSAILFAVFAIQTRALVRATYWYVAHSCCLILIYIAYAIYANNPYLFIWAGLCGVNTWILPFLIGGLRYTAKRIPNDDRATRLPTAIFAVTAVAATLAVWSYSSLTLIPSGSPIENLDREVSLNLLAGVLLFTYGIIVLLTQRHLFKLAVGLLVMTAGAHLTLVQMAPGFFTMVEIEVLTKVMGTVFAMLYAARLLAERFLTADTGLLLAPSDETEVPAVVPASSAAGRQAGHEPAGVAS